MIREDRELLAELYRLNADLASLTLRIMDGSATAAEQLDYAQRLTRAGERLQQRAAGTNVTIVDGTVIIPIPMHTMGSAGKCEQGL